ncbi:hypothetical protein D9M68_174820 [compost metagenome]
MVVARQQARPQLSYSWHEPSWAVTLHSMPGIGWGGLPKRRGYQKRGFQWAEEYAAGPQLVLFGRTGSVSAGRILPLDRNLPNCGKRFAHALGRIRTMYFVVLTKLTLC